MEVIPLSIAGASELRLDVHRDQRGSFTHLWDRSLSALAGTEPASVSLSTNRRAGTLRGLHYQASPRPEAKVVTCLRGCAFDVAVDLRRASPTFSTWVGVELRAGENAVILPAGVAHGFLTLEDDVELLYLISEEYQPGLQRGLRWNDPEIGIQWPLSPTVISDRDRSLPWLQQQHDLF